MSKLLIRIWISGWKLVFFGPTLLIKNFIQCFVKKIFCDHSFCQPNLSNKYYIKLLMFFIFDIIDIIKIAYIFRITYNSIYLLESLAFFHIPSISNILWYPWYLKSLIPLYTSLIFLISLDILYICDVPWYALYYWNLT